MELPKSSKKLGEQESASNRDALDSSVSLFLRLWSYGGPSQPPSGLALNQDSEVTELIRSIIRDGKGTIAEWQSELLSARFDSILLALSTAKALQQRFLTFHRKVEPQQVVPSVLIYPTDETDSGAHAEAAPQDMLANITSAQILIAESLYSQVKGVPGYRFNPKPIREAGETFGSEAIYELLWTDESTYGHLRQASPTGLKLVSRYQIQEELGRGATGAVYKAYDKLIGRTVALKTISISHDTPDRDGLIERLKQEAKAAGGLDHPNIITIYDVGQECDVLYLSMQYVKGITLAALLADVGVPSLPTFISWAEQILDAVGFAHARGVIHRDLKPANLMVSEQGVIKVLDFGIAKIENASLTQTGLVLGTPSYMAPEQISGKKIDHRADIFALGSVFYELVTREKPFRGDVATILYKIVNEDPMAPSLINPALPGNIEAVIRQALAKDPKERFLKCEAMRIAFIEQAALAGITAANRVQATMAIPEPLPMRQAAAVEHHGVTAQRRARRIWPSIALGLVVAVIATISWTIYAKSNKDPLPLLQKLVRALYRSSPPRPHGDGRLGESARLQPTRTDGNHARHDTLISGDAAEPTTISYTQPGQAPSRSAEITKFFIDEPPTDSGYETGPLHVIYGDGSEVVQILPPLKASTDEETAFNAVGFAGVELAQDHQTLGWTINVENCCASYSVPLSLIVFRDKKVLHTFDQGQMVRSWMFVQGGEQIAVVFGPTHGPEVLDYRLYDVKTGKLISEIWGDKDTQALAAHSPEWARRLQNLHNR